MMEILIFYSIEKFENNIKNLYYNYFEGLNEKDGVEGVKEGVGLEGVGLEEGLGVDEIVLVS